MPTIRNVAIIGASGSLGSAILEKLLTAKRFKIRVLRRPSSKAEFPPSVEVVDVSLGDLEDVKTALDGQDALISAVGTTQVLDQVHLSEACIAMGVYRFIPAEFGGDLENAKAQTMPIYAPHLKIHKDVIDKAKTSGLTYTFVHNGGFLDWGLQHDFLLKISDYKPLLIDQGDHPMSVTTVTSIADAVIGILDHPEETQNRAVYIEDTKITQKRLLELAMAVAPEKPWAPRFAKLHDLIAAADQNVSQGQTDEESIMAYLYRALMDPEFGGNFQTNDNKLLGVRGVTEEDIKEILRRYIK